MSQSIDLMRLVLYIVTGAKWPRGVKEGFVNLASRSSPVRPPRILRALAYAGRIILRL